jgi:hypothetical protein
MKFNMFLVTHPPSSGAKNCTGSLWFFIRGRLLDVVRPRSDNIEQPSTYEKPEAASAVLGS